MTLVEKISQTFNAWHNCQNSGNQEWLLRHEETLQTIVNNYLPKGSGFDSGTSINLDKSNNSRLVFETSFHHMNADGVYTGWTKHTVTVKPEFGGISVKVTGRNHNDIKDYIEEQFLNVLMENV